MTFFTPIRLVGSLCRSEALHSGRPRPRLRRSPWGVLLRGLLVVALAAVSLSACREEPPKQQSQWNQAVKAAPAPKGWVNAKDGAFRVKIPGSYLDAYEAAGGEKLPDAQVILSLPSAQAIHGYIPVLVIDHAKVTSDPELVKSTLKQDTIYKDFKDFTVLTPTKVEGLNVLAMKWYYTYHEVEMTAFMTMVSGNNHAYALKQDVPNYALDTYQPIVEAVLQTWTWNEPQK
ncbi:hypothetical protein [Mobiluncus mulieris]|uniref:hypothetical protein n=1 Tax=Mobiluncus mulieris TaxID=2052 RepID=UPI002015E689|nr:hypothetical protein [Mobiluncus mulieris]